MSTDIFNYLNSQIVELQQSPLNFKTQFATTIPANGEYDIDASSLASQGLTARDIIIDVKVKDSTVGSRTFGLYINSEAACTVATDGTTIKIFNDYNTSIDVYITIRA